MYEKILDELEEVIYIADTKTYELIYLNKQGKKEMGVVDYKGKKCYEVLQKKQRPCEFCTNAFLTKDKWYEWNIRNTVTRKYYSLKDKLIEIEGRKCRLEIAINNSDLAGQKESFFEKMRLQEIIKNIAIMISMGDQENRFLAEVGKFVKADRSYLFFVKDKCVTEYYDWCKKEKQGIKQRLEEVPFESMKRLIEKLEKNGYMYIEAREMIRESNPIDYTFLNEQEINSLVVVPICIQKKLVGFIGVDNPKDLMGSVEILKTVAVLLEIAYEKKCYFEQLKEVWEKDALTEVHSRNKFIEYKEQLERNKLRRIGVVFIDVNGLKEVNDRKGHRYGDKLLKTVASTLREIWDDAHIFRVGGDEFIIIKENIPRNLFEDKVRRTKQQINEESQAAVAIGSKWNEQNIKFEKMVDIADKRMYLDKKKYYSTNKHQCRFRYDSEGDFGWE